MKLKCLIFAALVFGAIFLGGCGTPNDSTQPWDKTPQVDNRPGYKSLDTLPLTRDSRE